MKGHIRKRGNKWAAVVYVGKDAQGKRKYKWFSGYDTKKEAQRALTQKLQELNSGSYVEPSKVKLHQFVDIWLKARLSKVRRITYENNERLLRLHAIPTLGQMPLSNIKGHHIQSLYSDLQETLSPSSIQTLHNTLHVLFADAEKWEYVAKNVMRSVSAPRVPKGSRTSWTFEDVERFRASIGNHPYGVAFVIATTTGMRRGEILGLRWSDVDLDSGVIRVQRSLKVEGNKKVLSEVKTSSSRRTVKLFDDDVRRLRLHRASQMELKLKTGPEFNSEDLVFVNAEGECIRPSSFSQSWTRFLKSHDLPHMPLHGSRHTHATLMLALGIHPKIVQERLGHSSIRVTMDLYSHVLPGMQETAVTKLEERMIKSQD